MEPGRAVIRLLFTRHGETEENKKRIICGQRPGQLTLEGQGQARKIGKALKATTFDYIYVSDLQRTVDTFQNIKTQAPLLAKVDTTLTKLLREKGGGVFEGKPLTAWASGAQQQQKDIRQFRCQNGESWQIVNQRCSAFLEQLIRRHVIQQNEGKQQIKILGVTHGGFLMEFHNVCNWVSKKVKPVFKNTALNCSFHEFEIEYPIGKGEYSPEEIGMRCVRQNDVAHLK